MSFIAFNAWAVLHAGTARLPAARGRWAPGGGEVFSRQRLATDALGSMNLTLTNVVIGSRWRIERQGSGALVATGVAAASAVVVPLDYFAGGDVQNDVRIKVRKGSAATLYKPYETLVTIGADAQSVYVAQIPDE